MRDHKTAAEPNGESVTTGTTRRGLLRGAAGLGAAGLAAGFVMDKVFSPAAVGVKTAAGAANTASAASASSADAPAHAEQVVAHVRNARTGEIDLYTGTRHVRLMDRQLAAHLTRAASA